MITNLGAQEFLKTQVRNDSILSASLEGFLGGDTFDDCVNLIRFDRLWVSAPLWFPVTADFHTCEDLFRVYAAFKYEEFYNERAQANFLKNGALGVRPPDFADVFVAGGSANYYHTIIDFLPRLILLAVHPPLQKLTVLLEKSMCDNFTEPVNHVFAVLGLKNVNAVIMDEGVAALADAFIPARLRLDMAVHIWRRFLTRPNTAKPGRGRRLYLTREGVGRRQAKNEEAVRICLAGRGFEAVDPGGLPFRDQIEMFAEADQVVALHGAAMTNIVFVPDHCQVVELCGPSVPEFYPNLARAIGLSFYRVQDSSAPPTDVALQFHDDFNVDVPKLERCLDGLGG